MDTFLHNLATHFAAAGYHLYLVGGSVRDELLSRTAHDADLTTDAPPELVRQLAQQSGATTFDLGEKFGTVSLIHEGVTIEITTFRTEAAGVFGQNLDEDLAHRDFTINAMARDMLTDELYDRFGGQEDLRSGIIRAVGDPKARFDEDPLRPLRGVRFAAQFGFRIEGQTALAIAAAAERLALCSAERVGRELTRLLVAPLAAEGIGLLADLGLLAVCLPEVEAMRTMQPGAYHFKDIYRHTIIVLSRVSATPLLRWTALLHDVAKPQTYGITDGEVHFFGHEVIGARMAKMILTRLHMEHELVHKVSKLIELHLRAGLYDDDWTDGAVRRFILEADDVLAELLELAKADLTTANQQKVAAGRERIDRLAARIADLQAQAEVAKMHSPLDGNELMAMFNRPPGRWIAPLKDYLLGLVLDGNLAQEDKETAAALAREYMAQHPN
ncbi:MAG: RNA nucleotidyltransferase [Candidatus Chloroheliales bacterium]|nr:MAG: RNA nucleotidyltransferase [Chloroflexota bacterium]